MPLHAPPSSATLYYQNLKPSSLDSSKASKIKADSSKPSKSSASKGLPPSYSTTHPSKGFSSFIEKYF
ncbi:hypothetical protein M422DRAFT_25010 [Sphaerobolus stellatus SS14]|nr:hypothetical protein M422DRAFT_25010 [Sphaerobolus stellatus SS14]